MLGKLEKSAEYTDAKLGQWQNIDEAGSFEEIFKAYHEGRNEAGFLKEFGYNAIFIDEAQDIDSSNVKWIRKLWRKDAKPKKCQKLWIFGDQAQNLKPSFIA